ncbi:MAG: extracellular solute-binding protein [Oscillospiraceae bacterium]|nr:extracellular solute-binding protein [Oscillospiraceae bacterium]
MRTLIITLIECSAVMSALTLLYMLSNRILAKRYAEKWRYYAWLIIVVGLIIPIRPNFGNAAITIEAPERLAMPVIEPGGRERLGNPYGSYDEFMINPNYSMDSGIENKPADSTGSAGEVIEPVEKFEITGIFTNILSSISWWDVAAIVWFFGMAVFVAYQIVKHLRFMKVANRWREKVEDEQTEALFRDLKAEMKITGHIDLQLCPCVASPMLVGFVRPRILLPETNFAQDELRLIVKHELVHYKRKDVLYRLLLLAATAIHWFNPVVHLLAKVVDMGCEVSCDDEVVKGTDLETRRYYSNTILGVVKYQTKLKTLLSTHLNNGKKTIKKRLSSIMDTGRKRGGFIIACIIVAAVLGTGLIIAVNTNKPLEDTPKKEKILQIDEQGNEVQINALKQLPETDKLVLWRNFLNKSLLDPAVKVFKRIYPDVEIEIRDFEDYWEYAALLQTEIPAGGGPDLHFSDTYDFPDMYKVMDSDAFYDLNNLIENDKAFDLDDYNKIVLDAGVYKGKRYIMPLTYMTNSIVTTKEALTAAEMDMEKLKSFDGYTGEIKKYLEKYDSTKFVYNEQQQYPYMFFPWCGVELIDYENKAVITDEKNFKKLMEAYKDIYKQDQESADFYSNNDEVNGLMNNEFVFHKNIVWDWQMQVFASLQGHGYTPVYFPFPNVTGGNTAQAFNIAAILNASPNKLNAYRFLKILLSEEIQGSTPQTNGVYFVNLPVLKEAVDIQIDSHMEIMSKSGYNGHRFIISEEIMREFVDMSTDVDFCRLSAVTPMEQVLGNYMMPYFKGEDTYENCLGKARNYLELYVSE